MPREIHFYECAVCEEQYESWSLAADCEWRHESGNGPSPSQLRNIANMPTSGHDTWALEARNALRTAADQLEYNEHAHNLVTREWHEDQMRTAAVQLEAVQARVRDYYYENGFTESAADHLIAFLTADTAPRKASIVNAILEASRLQLAAEESADTAPQSDRIEDVMQRNWDRRYGADTAPQEDR